MDQCDRCTLKGDIEKCKLAICNFHSLWIVKTILAENAKLKDELLIQKDSNIMKIGEIAEEQTFRQCNFNAQIQKYQIKQAQLRKTLTDALVSLDQDF